MAPKVREILSWYQGDDPVILERMARLLAHGRMGGTGKMIIADASAGIENGPAAEFHGNPDSYGPGYHFRLASEAGLSALIAPQGMIELCARDFSGEFPVFQKIDHTVVLNSWQGHYSSSTIESAFRLGCIGVSMSLPVGNAGFAEHVNQLKEQIDECKSLGLLALVSVTRAGQADDEKKREALPIDQAAQAVHLVCQMGAHIVEAPALDLPVVGLREWYAERQISTKNHEARADQLLLSAFQKQRLVMLRMSRYWSDEQRLEHLGAWVSAGVSGVNIGSHAYVHPSKVVLQDISKFQEVLLGHDREEL